MPRPIAVLVVALLALRLVPADASSSSSSSFSSSSGLRRRGDPHQVPNRLGRRGTPSLSSRRGAVRRRLAGLIVGRRSRRSLACHDDGDDDADDETSPPTRTNTTTSTGSLLRSYWQAVRGPTRKDHNSNVVTGHSHPSNQDTAADRFKDAEGIFASGQAAVDDDDNDEVNARPSSSSPVQVTSGSSPPSASPTTTSSPPATSSTCPENPSASLQVICQGGTVPFPTLCHAKQALGDALTDCLLLDTTPVESGGAAGATTTVVAAASASASQGEGSEAARPDCPEGDDDDDPDDDHDGQGPLILCDGDMIFSSWCEAFRHHFARDECEEY